MTAVAAGEQRKTIGKAERIGTIAIVTGAARRLWSGGWRTLALAIVMAAVSWGVQAGVAAAGFNPYAPTLGAVYLVSLLLSAASTAFGAALAFRLFVRGPDRWLVFDRPLLTCAAVMGGTTLTFALISMVYSTATRGTAPAAAGAGGLLFALAYCVIGFVILRLTLWPVALAVGRPGVTLAIAWRAMRKATRGTILGYIVFAIPFMVVMAARWPDLMAGRPPQGLWMGLFSLVGAFYALAVYAMAATVYALRIENPATVADVFD